MALIDTQIELPEVVYHGTQYSAIDGIIRKPINPDFWKPDKDFGAGFYTTIDLHQATLWAKKPFMMLAEFANQENRNVRWVPKIPLGRTPVVLVLEIHPDRYDDNIRLLDFRGEGRAWVNFILRHRLHGKPGQCRCELHPQIVCGPMADNDTGTIISTFKQNQRSPDRDSDVEWFREQITMSKDGRRLNGLQLGDQIAFFDERLNGILKVRGYYVYEHKQQPLQVTIDNFEKEWVYYDADHSPQTE